MIVVMCFVILFALAKHKLEDQNKKQLDLVIIVGLSIFFIVFLNRDKEVFRGNKLRQDGTAPYLLATQWAFVVLLLEVFIQSW